MLFILGRPRSGTTWISRIFDSHPDVLYRHEPDVLHRDREVPFYCLAENADRYVEAIREEVETQLRVRHIRSAGSIPVFRKRYLDAPSYYFRRSLIFGLKAAERMAPPLTRRIQVPDLVDIDGGAVLPVLKSVSAIARAAILRRAFPEARILLVLRHPCGQIASTLRGWELGRLTPSMPKADRPPVLFRELPPARIDRYGISPAAAAAMQPHEWLAWQWTIQNDVAMDALAGDPGTKILRYEDLCEDPEGVTRELFDFAGLDWNPQTAAFLRASTRSRGRQGYYQTSRDPLKAAYKWREQLSPDMIAAISGLVAPFRPGALYVAADAVAEVARA